MDYRKSFWSCLYSSQWNYIISSSYCAVLCFHSEFIMKSKRELESAKQQNNTRKRSFSWKQNHKVAYVVQAVRSHLSAREEVIMLCALKRPDSSKLQHIKSHTFWLWVDVFYHTIKRSQSRKNAKQINDLNWFPKTNYHIYQPSSRVRARCQGRLGWSWGHHLPTHYIP